MRPRARCLGKAGAYGGRGSGPLPSAENRKFAPADKGTSPITKKPNARVLEPIRAKLVLPWGQDSGVLSLPWGCGPSRRTSINLFKNQGSSPSAGGGLGLGRGLPG